MRSRRAGDVLGNVEAREFLLDLQGRGIGLAVDRGQLAAAQVDALTSADVSALRRHGAALRVLVLMADARCVDRLLELHRLSGRAWPWASEGRCYACGGELPDERPAGRCGWCALAARVYAGAPVPPDVIDLFDESIRGAASATPSANPLEFDEALPA
ncbi:hypothetical protein [Luteitalea sp.]